MIVVLSGTNRPASVTRRVADLAGARLLAGGREVRLLDLAGLPPAIFDPASYAEKPPAFLPFQEAVLAARGILTVTPEYNGSFPGALKYFIDMLKFPESLKGVPAGFVGIGDGEWGGLRAVEQLEMVFHYRSAHLYGKRVFLKGIRHQIGPDGTITDPKNAARLDEMVDGFAAFADALAAAR